ncbi:hypothetical protein [Shewanella sp. CG12_big_fil_rev_8_21_14_0_65_47_15]|uniref:hypothetical protein n=1 Tax=Shewanella sp. CG12_big_fil_rev_8_21_14_0_65_47_15 TaxID=1975537 RepID=UPI0025D9BBBF|nr:hypothetical protein [Shewanella sp. CG12_big_fil_rev_8_21_14_0_65_47_15]
MTGKLPTHCKIMNLHLLRNTTQFGQFTCTPWRQSRRMNALLRKAAKTPVLS